MMDWQARAQRSVVGTGRVNEKSRAGIVFFFFFSDSKILVFAFHGHKELNDNLWDGHEGVATREGVEKGEKKMLKV
jgi:hypothetical protein